MFDFPSIESIKITKLPFQFEELNKKLFFLLTDPENSDSSDHFWENSDLNRTQT